jgi:hypothetical protein
VQASHARSSHQPDAKRAHPPQSWLAWAGLIRLPCGFNAHRMWHYTRDQQPSRFVRWYCRSVDAPKVRAQAGAQRMRASDPDASYPQPETAINLWHSFAAWATGSKPPWTLEAEEAAEEAAAEEAAAANAAAPADDKAAHELDTHSVSSSLASAVQLRNAKRRLTAFGVLGVYLVWCGPACMRDARCRLVDARVLAPTRRAIFAWFIFTCAPRGPLAFCATHIDSRNARPRAQTACCVISCWATRRSSLSRARGASATALERPQSGRHGARVTRAACGPRLTCHCTRLPGHCDRSGKGCDPAGHPGAPLPHAPGVLG